MRLPKIKYISPIWLSVSHLLPTLFLLCLAIVGMVLLNRNEENAVLGAQTSLPQIKTESVDERLDELSRASVNLKSEAVNEELRKLRN